MLKNLKESKDTGKLATELSHLAHTYVSSYRPTASDLKKHRILKELRKNKNIVILKPDKGNGVVILDRVEYDKGLFKIINDTTKLSVILRRNLFPENLINKYISKYIRTAVKGGKTKPYSGVEPQETPKFFFKIPYVGHFSVTAQRSIRKLANRLCKPIDLRLVFTTFKVRNLFNVKDAVPEGLRTRVVYKFSCASCNACYVGETSRHFSTRVREHLLSDRSSNVFKHLQGSEFCRASCTPDCFEILDSAATKYQVKLKESMFIKWEKPDLNQQVKHNNLTLSL